MNVAFRLPLSLVVVSAAALAACGKPASIALSPTTPIVIETDRPLPLPAVVGLKEDGSPVEEPPVAKFTVEPAGFVNIEGDKLVALKNGKAKLTATAEDLPPVSVDVTIRVIDEMKIVCPNQCELRVGESADLTSQAMGLGAPVTEGLSWTSSDPNRATVDNNGKVTALSAGNVVITARIGKTSAEAALLVRAAVDELRLICPGAPLLVRQQKGQAATTVETSCEVVEGEEMSLAARLLSAGAVVEGEPLEWKSSDPSARVVNGVVTGDKVGGAMIEVKAAGLAVEMPVSVQKAPKKKSPACATSDDAYGTKLDFTMKLSNAAGDAVEPAVSLRCTQAGAKACVDAGVAKIAAAANPLALDAKGIEAFAAVALDDVARRCCCKR